MVHTLSLAEALTELGVPVRVVALGEPGTGFYRQVRAPVTILPAPSALPTLDERVFASVDALETGLAEIVADSSTSCTARTASPLALRRGSGTRATT